MLGSVATMGYFPGHRLQSSDNWAMYGASIPFVSCYIFLIFSLLVITFLSRSLKTGSRSNRILSSVINVYLCIRHPIRSRDGFTRIPFCPYQFPNGQGNVAKFLKGESLSKEWRGQYGPIYRIWAGFTPEIVLTRSEHIQAVFRDSNMHIKGSNMDSGWLLGELLGQCIGLLNTDDWSRVRSITGDAFHRLKAASYIRFIQHRVDGYFEELQKSPLIHRSGKSMTLRPTEDLKFLPFWILADTIYGKLTKDMERQLNEIVSLREDVWKDAIAGGLARFSLGRILPTKTNHKLGVFKAKWSDFNQRACQRAAEMCIDAPIVSMYVAMSTNQISKTELLHTLDEALFANLDVTLGNFSWNPVFLAAHSNTQEELRSEIRNVRESKPSNLEGYITTSSTLLTSCILESARLKPMAPFSPAQAAPTVRVLGDFIIPAGTNFVVDTMSLNILDPYWGKDHMLYRPRRFLEDRNPTPLRYCYWRFGFGPRQCLGKYVADIILKILLIHMVENYEMRLKQEESRDPEEWEKKPDTWISFAMQDIICERL